MDFKIDSITICPSSKISMNLFQIYGFDAVPEGSEHIIENILGSFFIVYNVQGILIQPSIIPGVYFFKFPLICKRIEYQGKSTNKI